MGVLSNHLHTFFNETPTTVDAAAEGNLGLAVPAVGDATNDQAGDADAVLAGNAGFPTDALKDVQPDAMPAKVEELFGKPPTVDKSKLDLNGMAKLRLAAFEAEDADAARTWAANLAELKKQCFSDNTVQPCQTLATESMFMAAKYYQMWDESMAMWDQQGDGAGAHGFEMPAVDSAVGVPEADHSAGDAAAAMAADATGGEQADLAPAGVDGGAEEAAEEALAVAEAGMGGGAVALLASTVINVAASAASTSKLLKNINMAAFGGSDNNSSSEKSTPTQSQKLGKAGGVASRNFL
mmetsp:Transcript_3507/g.8289  ORF Transcript_3507/g.8289 Transcript_3507/m.8289 type:complete len:296 (+) Transcript_3507:257-1144(+)|eukprot:CAMPEP_0179000182 /NCGR_PEP_ID=MMETSP0795-20121207/10511_1 /TAXON_ID=88552 /ORGANISM="Amoebophrya sp., Strain Ameob2" /LENGTH=295 /DNA_ID=CAMNT_0020693113 /DNA_START=244 /DNA_END=1131 /DNA_ORIENTATION=+